VSNTRRVKLPRKLRRAFRDYLRDGEQAAEAVAVIARAAAAAGRPWPREEECRVDRRAGT
jgi:hypothetical protein